MSKYYYYITSNKNRKVLYVGYTENLKRRLNEHSKGTGGVFTKKYKVSYLVYLEEFENKNDAKKRESQLKNWHKDWKWNLVKESNPDLITLEIN